jgi:predicted porin
MEKAGMAAAIMSTAVVCHAQSSVTLYGALDDGITYTNNQGGHYNV